MGGRASSWGKKRGFSSSSQREARTTVSQITKGEFRNAVDVGCQTGPPLQLLAAEIQLDWAALLDVIVTVYYFKYCKIKKKL